MKICSGRASGSKAPVSTPPISQRPAASLEQKRTSSGGCKREARGSDTGTPSDSRSAKRAKLASARGTPSLASSQKTQLFQRLVSNQIPEAVIKEWDRLSLSEAAHDKVLANAKSLFLDLKNQRAGG